MGLIDDIASVLSDVKSLFSSIGDAIKGDQVPEYPIKSKNTLQGILNDIANAYPPPTSVAMAKEQLVSAQRQSEEAYAKGGAVNTTYGMIFDKLIQTLKNYISYEGQIPGKDQSCPAGYYRDPSTGDCKLNAPTPPKTAGMSGLAMAAIFGLGIALLSKPKRR